MPVPTSTPTTTSSLSPRVDRFLYEIAQFIRCYGSSLSALDKAAALDVVNGRRPNCYVSLGTEIFYLTREEGFSDKSN